MLRLPRTATRPKQAPGGQPPAAAGQGGSQGSLSPTEVLQGPWTRRVARGGGSQPAGGLVGLPTSPLSRRRPRRPCARRAPWVAGRNAAAGVCTACLSLTPSTCLPPHCRSAQRAPPASPRKQAGGVQPARMEGHAQDIVHLLDEGW